MRLTPEERSALYAENVGGKRNQAIFDLLETCNALESEHRAALEPGPCGKHPKMFWVKTEEFISGAPHGEPDTIEYCTLCAEVRAAEESMREACLRAAKRGFNSKSKLQRKQAVYDRINAVPLSSEVKHGQ